MNEEKITTITIYENDKHEFNLLKSKQEVKDKRQLNHADFFRQLLNKIKDKL